MNFSEFLEVLISLSLQVAILVIVGRLLARYIRDAGNESRLWKLISCLILALTIRAVIFPHLRTFHPLDGTDLARTLDIAAISQKLGLALLIIWGVGCFIAFLQFVRKWILIHRFLRTCRPWSPGESEGLAASNAVALKDKRHEQILFLVSDHLHSPFCWQIHRPLIVLPEFLLDFESEELRLIVRHECEHLQMGDPLGLFIQRLVEIIFWFHPFVWALSQHAAQAREFACDRASVNTREEVARYLRCLLKIVEHGGLGPRNDGLELAFSGNAGLLARRAEHLTLCAQQSELSPRRHFSHAHVMSFGGAVLAALFVGVFLWLPFDLMKSPRTRWTPWPAWTASALHTMGFNVRDYDIYDRKFRADEIRESIHKRRREGTQVK